VTNYETLAANALRRGLRAGERVVVPRVDDLDALAASSGGKIEIESLDEGREGAIFENIVKSAVLTVFKARVAPERTRDVVATFEEGTIAHTGEDVPSTDLAQLVETVPALRAVVADLTRGDESPAAVAAAVSFVLEGLHLSKRLNKDASGRRATYRGRS
jgi:magnesium chelatase subunit I